MNLSITRFTASLSLMTTVCLAVLILVGSTVAGLAANKETVQTTSAYFGQNSVRVDIYGHNEVSLLEYFNLLIFDDTRLDFVSIAADRDSLWAGIYPTQIVGDHIYVHEVRQQAKTPQSLSIAPPTNFPKILLWIQNGRLRRL